MLVDDYVRGRQFKQQREITMSNFFGFKSIATAALFGIATLYGLAGITQVDPGEYTVLVKNLGDNKGMQPDGLNTGTHWIEPFIYDTITYDTRWQQEELPGLQSATADGQPVEVDMSLQIGLVDNGVPTLHEEIGPNWYNEVVFPATRALVRNKVPTQSSDTVYTNEGRENIQRAIEEGLQDRLSPLGIRVTVNLRDLRFLNEDFVATIEEKAQAAQQVEIETRNAQAAEQTAFRTANIAEGEKQKSIKESEAISEKLRLQGEGERLRDEARAAGILAVATAEADSFCCSEALVAVAWAENLGPNVKVYGIPTGAPGTTSLMDVSGIVQQAAKSLTGTK